MKSFFSWANVQGHNPEADSFLNIYNWSSQVYAETPGSQLEQDINGNVNYDAAAYLLGAPWRIPTAEQFDELFTNVEFLNSNGTIKDGSETDKRITMNGIVGVWCQSKINGNRLFISCSGRGNGPSWLNYGNGGYYWTSSISANDQAKRLFISSAGIFPHNNDGRFYGFPIRPVQG